MKGQEGPRQRRAGPVAATPPARDASVIWHDTECGSYEADLPLWEELADEAGGPILELGCGTGRVALHLAHRGHRVWGLDLAEELVGGFNARAGDLSARASRGDGRDFELNRQFGLVLAPMQLLQLFADRDERLACLRRVATHLAPGGLAAFAIVESVPAPNATALPLPDTREVDGWVYSSLPVDSCVDSEAIRVRRLRQTVSPDGELEEELCEVALHSLAAETVEREGREAALVPAGRRPVPPTDAHVGSTAVLLRREA
jgi:SAM-dependent methyltransferase